MENFDSLLQSGTVAALRSYMLEHFPYVVLQDDMKLRELKTLAKRWNQIAQDCPKYKKRPSDSQSTSSADRSLVVTSANVIQTASKKQKSTPQHTTRLTKRNNTTRLRNVSRASKAGLSATQRRTKSSKLNQPNNNQLIDFGIEEIKQKRNLQGESSRKPQGLPHKKSTPAFDSRDHSASSVGPSGQRVVNQKTTKSKTSSRFFKQPVEYSSSLTGLSDDEDHLDTHERISPPEAPASTFDYLSDEAFLMEVGELEGLVFEPPEIPSITSTQCTPCGSSSTTLKDSPDPHVDAQVNLMDFDDEEHLQSLDKNEVNCPAPQLPSKLGACKCECQEQLLLLKARIQKLEDLVLP
ncbi:hypothetical protein DFH28DRAFT_1160525 [Melampsora americana]|nr:hypothetical protein DFH28DRAFT_1160525 [Melampsora americana]